MPTLMVMDYGNKNGVQSYRVCGDKSELERVVKECVEMGHKFVEQPELERVHRGQWTVVLNLKVPVKVGSQHENN